MNKFVKFDPRFGISRLPTRYSLGDLSAIRDLFRSQKDPAGSQLPILPPKTEIIDDKDTEGYLVELPVNLHVVLKDFINQALRRSEERYNSGYDPGNFALATYVNKRQSCIKQLQEILIEILEQERRLGIYNLFWLSISKAIIRAIQEVLPVSRKEDTLRLLPPEDLLTQKFNSSYKIHLHLIFNDLLLEMLKRVDWYFQKEDEYKRGYIPYFTGTKRLKLGASFNYEFAMAVIQAQTHMIVPDIRNASTSSLLQQVLVEENERYHSRYPDFYKVYTLFKTHIEQSIQNNDWSLIKPISDFLRIHPSVVREIPIDIILFEPLVISYLSNEVKEMNYTFPEKSRGGFFKRRPERLIDLFGEDIWEVIIQDYLNLADDLRKSEIISLLRDRVCIVLSSKSFPTPKTLRSVVYKKPESAEKISYNFTPGQKVISDLRNVTLLFLDLRGYMEVSAGNISSEALKQNLYKFFDPTMEIIDHFHGSIKYYAGDGILASFGSGPWKDYHGLNAVRAAIEIQKFFKALKDNGSMVFKGMGIGIHTGLLEDAYFFLNPIDKSSTVIGFTANLTSRLSSGKTERSIQKLDIQSIFTLNEYLITLARSTRLDSTALVIFEEQLLKILDAIQAEQLQEENSQAPQPEFNVNVIKGVLDNRGIALSDIAFQHIREVVPLKEIPSKTVVDYLLEDQAIREAILFKKAGDASFKGIEGKFPVWGVYRSRWIK